MLRVIALTSVIDQRAQAMLRLDAIHGRTLQMGSKHNGQRVDQGWVQAPNMEPGWLIIRLNKGRRQAITMELPVPWQDLVKWVTFDPIYINNPTDVGLD